MSERLTTRIQDQTARVCVVGLGYVGLPLLIQATSKGWSATGLDISEGAVTNARQQDVPATTDPIEALGDAEVVIVCVPTPVDSGHRPDLTILKESVQTITSHLTGEALIIIESTVAPGMIDSHVRPILEAAGRELGKDTWLAHCPERIDPGNASWDVSNIPRIVGGHDQDASDMTASFYQGTIDAEARVVSSIRAAEAVKVVENTFRDINIAFVNELAQGFDHLGLDAVEVLEAAATKPFGFMLHLPGAGVGGHCIAVDPYYLIESGSEVGFDHRFLRLGRETNEGMPAYTVQRLEGLLSTLDIPLGGCRVALLGMAYKPSIGDQRESPALKIKELLETKGAIVQPYDPYVPGIESDLDTALEGCTAAILATAHPELKELGGRPFKTHGVKAVVDGRNCMDGENIKADGILYSGIGRS